MPFYLKQLKNRTKYMKQCFSDIAQEAAQSNDSWEKQTNKQGKFSLLSKKGGSKLRAAFSLNYRDRAWSSGRPRRLECTAQSSREERSLKSSFRSFPKSCARFFMWVLANVCIWGICPSTEKEKSKERSRKIFGSHTVLGIVPIFTNQTGIHVALSRVLRRILCWSEAKSP